MSCVFHAESSLKEDPILDKKKKKARFSEAAKGPGLILKLRKGYLE